MRSGNTTAWRLFSPVSDLYERASNLEDLPVYGNILQMYSTRVNERVSKVGGLFNELLFVDRNILILYVSYVLASKGYDVKYLTGPSFAEDYGEKAHTSRFTNKDWIDNLELWSHNPQASEVNFDDELISWDQIYRSKDEDIRVAFLYSFDVVGLSSLHEGLKQRYFADELSTIVIVHPALERVRRADFLKLKQQMPKIANGGEVIFTTEEFSCKYLPDKRKRDIVELQWKALRDHFLLELRKEYPFLILTTRAELIEKIPNWFKEAEVQYHLGRYNHAIQEIGKACEAMLQVLYEIRSGKTTEEYGLGRLLGHMKSHLDEEFGERIYGDLDFITYWRNMVTHPKPKEPSSTITIEVIRRAQLFHELFLMKVISPRG